LACEICNQYKSNLDPQIANIIDPYENEPAEHLTFIGSVIIALSEKGLSSIKCLHLERAELLENRQRRLLAIKSIIEVMLSTNLPLQARKAIYEDLIQIECNTTSEYSAMVKACLQQMEPHLPAGIKPI
jgi:hypothetical protein